MVREAFVTSGGRSRRYLEAGSGKAAVLIHAFPLNADMWRPQLEHPPAGWRLVAPDLPGFGPSESGDVPDLPRSMDAAADDLGRLLDALGIGRAVIGGLSMGGYITFGFFRYRPERFAGAILADTRAGADTPEGRDGRQKMLELVRSRGSEAVADQMLPKLLSAKAPQDRPELVARVRQMIASTSAATIAAAIEAMMARPDSTPDLSRMAFPSAVIVGADDVLTPPAESEAMHHRLPESRLVVIPDAGHLSNLEAPGPFSQALAEFLTKSRLH
jgi:pimeloyl-ACP methyl ester carboxylesterase